MREVDSFRFVESRSRGHSILSPDGSGAEATFEARGTYQSPDRLHKRAVFRDIHTPTASHIQSMSFGDNRLVTDPATGEWTESEDSGWRGEYFFGNPIDFFESVVSEFGPDAYRGITTLAGVRVHRLAYNTPDSGRRSAAITSLDVEILVGVDDSLVREMRTRSSWKQRPCPLDQECLAIEIIPGWESVTLQFSYPGKAVTLSLKQEDPTVGICNRTEQVRDAILKRIDGVDDCKAVTMAHLSTIDGEMILAGRDIGELQPGDFDGLTSLDTLDLRAANLTSLEAGVFDGLTWLTVLDLRGNWYNAYPDWLGSGHWNRLASLEKGVFAGLTWLRELYLGVGNQLTHLEVGLFDGLRALEKLDLNGNRLTSLEAGLFDDLRALEYLDIGGQLTSVEASVFDRLTSLTELKMAYWGKTAPPQGLFDKLTSLRELSMGTDVASLEAGVLVGLPITRLSVSLYVATPPGESSRGLTTLPVGLFHGLTSVKVLDISGQLYFPPDPLATLQAGTFEGLDALEELDLHYNQLAILEAGAFDGLSSLKSLDLSRNKLASLEVGVFRGLTTLDTLILHSNPLRKIDKSVFSDPMNLERLELPPSTEVPRSSSNDEWTCSEGPHYLLCSVHTKESEQVVEEREEAAGDLLWSYYIPSIHGLSVDSGVALMDVGGGSWGEAAELHALEVPTGDVLWRYRSEEGPMAKVLLADTTVYFVQRTVEDTGRAPAPVVNPTATPTAVPTYEFTVHALDADTGDRLWQKEFVVEPGRSTNRLFASDGVLYVHSSSLFALNAATGELIWEYPADGFVRDVAGGVAYIYAVESRGDAFEAVDAATGELLWSLVHPQGGLYDLAGADDGITYLEDGGSIEARDTVSGSLIWRYEPGGRIPFFDEVGDGVVTVSSRKVSTGFYPEIHPIDRLCVLDARSGELLWCVDTGHDLTNFADLDSGVVYLPLPNRLSALDARTGTAIWDYDLEPVGEEPYVPWPRVWDGVLLLSLSAFDAVDGTPLWRYLPDERKIKWSFIEDGTVFVRSEQGVLAFSTVVPEPGSLVDRTEPRQSMTRANERRCRNGIAVPDPEGNPGLVNDCAILLSIENTLSLHGNLNWSADTPISEWDGISLLERGLRTLPPSDGSKPVPVHGLPDRVRVLSLENLKLGGTIPQEIAELPELDVLRLVGVQLTGGIPPELADLTRLRLLNLSLNRMEGEIPPELGLLTSLEELFLQQTRVNGEIPEELSKLVKLKSLNLRSNNLTGSIPPELGGLSELRELDLTGNELVGTIPEEIANLRNLMTLYLGWNQLIGEFPPAFSLLTHLRELRLSGNRLTGEIPSSIADLGELTWLALGRNELSGPIPEKIGDLTMLKTLELSDNSLTGGIPPEVGDLKNLRDLYLYGNELTGTIPPELGQLPDLKVLNLCGNDLTGSIPP